MKFFFVLFFLFFPWVHTVFECDFKRDVFEVLFSDDFSSEITVFEKWGNITNSGTLSTVCGSVSGSKSLVLNGNPSRYVSTKWLQHLKTEIPIQIQFYVRSGNSDVLGECSSSDLGEDLYVNIEYQNSSSVENLKRIIYYEYRDDFKFYDIKVELEEENFKLSFVEDYAEIGEDFYAIDDVKIGFYRIESGKLNCSSSFYYMVFFLGAGILFLILLFLSNMIGVCGIFLNMVTLLFSQKAKELAPEQVSAENKKYLIQFNVYRVIHLIALFVWIGILLFCIIAFIVKYISYSMAIVVVMSSEMIISLIDSIVEVLIFLKIRELKKKKEYRDVEVIYSSYLEFNGNFENFVSFLTIEVFFLLFDDDSMSGKVDKYLNYLRIAMLVLRLVLAIFSIDNVVLELLSSMKENSKIVKKYFENPKVYKYVHHYFLTYKRIVDKVKSVSAISHIFHIFFDIFVFFYNILIHILIGYSMYMLIKDEEYFINVYTILDLSFLLYGIPFALQNLVLISKIEKGKMVIEFVSSLKEFVICFIIFLQSILNFFFKARDTRRYQKVGIFGGFIVSMFFLDVIGMEPRIFGTSFIGTFVMNKTEDLYNRFISKKRRTKVHPISN